jgi:uncharacterized protein YjiS (DUF1127 family)
MTTIFSTNRSSPSVGWVRWLASWPAGVVAHRRRRETIKTLQELNDHQLRDIGLTRDQIETAANGEADPDNVRLW